MFNTVSGVHFSELFVEKKNEKINNQIETLNRRDIFFTSSIFFSEFMDICSTIARLQIRNLVKICFYMSNNLTQDDGTP